MNTDARNPLPSRNDVSERALVISWRNSRTVLAARLFLVSALATGTLQGQRTPADSLAERLRQAEAAIAALQTQVAEQAQGGARTSSGARIELTGRVLVKAFGNSRRVNNVDNPQVVLVDPDPATLGVARRGAGMSIRESRLGLRIDAAEVLRGTFVGDVDMDFHGGQQPSSGGRTFPLARLRTARAILRWTGAHLLIGQESPLISGLNPASLGDVGTPTFAASGNLWLWLPQVRAGLETAGRVRVGLQGAVLAPTSGDPAAAFETDFDLAERSSRPFLQARGSLSWGDAELTREIGCGVHEGRLIVAVGSEPERRSRAFACDARIPVVEQLEIRGEYFRGEVLRGLGGGGIGQNFVTSVAGTAPLATVGGWAQVNVHPTPILRIGAGFGTDNPDDLSVRHRNDAIAAHLILQPAGPMFFGLEGRRLRTSYVGARYSNDYVTLGAGFGF